MNDELSIEYLTLQNYINDNFIDEFEFNKIKKRMKDLEDIISMIIKTESEIEFNIDLTIDINNLN